MNSVFDPGWAERQQRTEVERLRAENEGLRLRVEGQDLLLRAYRLGTRPPERAFKLLERAAKALGE